MEKSPRNCQAMPLHFATWFSAPTEKRWRPPGRAGATDESEGAEIKLWDVAAGRERFTLSGHPQHVFAMTFSPCGKTLCTGGLDKTIRFWDVVSGQHRLTLPADN